MFRPHARCAVLASGLVTLAGCAGGGYGLSAGRAASSGPLDVPTFLAGRPVTSVPLDAAASAALPAAEVDAPGDTLYDSLYPMPSPWRMVLVGAEFGMYYFADDVIGDWFGDGTYGGVKFSWEPGLNWGVSLSAGYYKAENVTEGGEDIEVFPVRATLEVGGLLFFTQSRWFVGGGMGYAYMEALPSDDKIDLWPTIGLYLDDEWSAHAVGGFEFRNETLMSLRFEGGHAWLFESEANVWMLTGTLALQF